MGTGVREPPGTDEKSPEAGTSGPMGYLGARPRMRRLHNLNAQPVFLFHTKLAAPR